MTRISFLAGSGIFLLATMSRLVLGASQNKALSLGQLHITHPLRMLGAIPPLPQYIFMGWNIIKHRDNSTFYFLS